MNIEPISGYQLLIWSEEPDELQKFYKNVLELEPIAKLTLPDDYGYGFRIGKEHKLWIGKHSKVEGNNKDPHRFIVQLYVSDVHEWFEKIKDKVEVVAEPFETPPTRGDKDPRYCFTFADPEDNLLQLMTDK